MCEYGRHLVWYLLQGEMTWRTEDIVKVIEEHASSTALVFLSGKD